MFGGHGFGFSGASVALLPPSFQPVHKVSNPNINIGERVDVAVPKAGKAIAFPTEPQLVRVPHMFAKCYPLIVPKPSLAPTLCPDFPVPECVNQCPFYSPLCGMVEMH